MQTSTPSLTALSAFRASALAALCLVTACGGGSADNGTTPGSLSAVSGGINPVAATVRLAPDEVFRSEATGVAMKLPANATAGQLDRSSGLLVMGNEAIGAFALGASAGGVLAGQSVIAALAQEGLGLALTPLSVSLSSATEVSGQFQFFNEASGVSGLAQVDIRVGPAGNVLALFGTSAFEANNELTQFMSEAVASIEFSTPFDAPVLGIEGAVLELDTQDNVNNISGSGSISSRDEGVLAICANGAYELRRSSDTFVSFLDGAPGGSTSESEQHSGSWSAINTFGASAVLLLQSTDGVLRFLDVEANGQAAIVDGEGYRFIGQC